MNYYKWRYVKNIESYAVFKKNDDNNNNNDNQISYKCQYFCLFFNEKKN